MFKCKSIKPGFVRSSSYVFSSLVLSTSLMLCITAPLQAADFTIQNGQTETNQNITLSTGETGTILSGGTIQDNATDAITATGNVTIDNAGTIVTTNGGSDGVHHSTAGMLTLFNRATGTITGVDDGVEADVLTLTNWGAITGEYGVYGYSSITSLINTGTITGTGIDGVTSGTITSLINSGTITGADDGVYSDGTVASLTNSGTITGVDDGVDTITLGSLVNTSTGMIIGGNNGVEADGTITSLINSGTITGGNDGVYADSTITSLTNSGTITGGDDGVNAMGTITSLINSGTITGSDDGVITDGTLTSLINSGTITGKNSDGVDAGAITSLINTGTIIGTDDGVDSFEITKLTNSGKITGGDHAIIEINAADTLLTLLPGSDIFGKIDLGGGVNTLVVGNGLSIDHVFTGNLPDVINSNGAPLFVIGNRVVVVDTSTTLDQQDEQLFDLTSGIWGTVFNNIGDGRNPAATFANGPQPQFSLGAVPPGETANSYKNTHMWASVFGNRRTQNGDNSVRHDLGGLIAGLDGRLNSTTRLGAFFGASQTDIDTANDQQETEVENIFGGLYASYKTNGLTIDLGVTGGVSENDSTRLVDNNQVNGLETVSSSFDGTFIAPELSISSQYDMGAAGILQPTLRVGYAGMFLDGYTETGASAPLTVGDRDLHLLHARFELAVLMSSKGEDSLGFTFSPYVGIEGRSLVDGEAVNVTLLGQNLSFNPGGNDDIASAFAGMRLSVLQTENFGIFAGVEGSIDTEQSSTLTGNLGLKWLF